MNAVMATMRAAPPGPAILQSPHLGSQLYFALKSRAGGSHRVRWALLSARCQQEMLSAPLFFFLPMFFFSWKLLLPRCHPHRHGQSRPACRGAASTGHVPGIAPPLWSEIKVGQETRFGRAEDWTVTSLAIGVGTENCQCQPASGQSAGQSGQPWSS